jgi:hypothetical protein
LLDFAKKKKRKMVDGFLGGGVREDAVARAHAWRCAALVV